MDATFLPGAEPSGSGEVARGAADAVRCLAEVFGPGNDADRRLVYVTGRHRDSVRRLIDDGRLPVPHLLVCDVGTSLYAAPSGDAFREVSAYRLRLREIVAEDVLGGLRDALGDFEGLREQEAEKQGAHKLSYYCEADAAEALGERVGDEIRRARHALEVLWSVDPGTGEGLLDVLPRGVHKGFALDWLHASGLLGEGARRDTVYAGDSRNDLGALTSGVRGILVGNAPDRLRREIRDHEERAGTGQRVYFARRPGTEGVLEGCRVFGAPL